MEKDGESPPATTLYASKPVQTDAAGAGSSVDPLAEFGMPIRASILPAPALTRAWDSGLVKAPSGFDVVHGGSLAVPRAPRARTFVTLHDLAWRHLPFAYPRHGRRWHEAAFRKALRGAHEFVVPSVEIEVEIHDAGGNPDLVTVIEPGCDHLPPPDPAVLEESRRRLGVSGPYILSVGTLEPRKNLGALIDAFEKARDTDLGNWTLIVVGPEGWGPGVAPKQGVVFAGHVSEAELSALYSGAEMLGYVPLLEGFGLPPLEAMQAGIPVVSSPIPSTGGASYEVDPKSRDQITDALVDVATDSLLRAKLIEAGQMRAKKLTWEACARQHVALWKSPRPS
jgi:glycosyltransferase involved in cell wall biosynthesis